jgi:hypothetical protein
MVADFFIIFRAIHIDFLPTGTTVIAIITTLYRNMCRNPLARTGHVH